MKEVRAWLPEADLSNLRLHPANHRTVEIEQPEGRADKRGQFVLPVSPPEQNADALFEQAQAAERAATRADPLFAEAWYNLSDILDDQGRSEDAIGCLGRALRAAPDYGDAMFNLALMLQRNNKYGDGVLAALSRH